MTHWLFIMISSITTMLSQNVQDVLMSCSIWSSFSGHPMMMYPFSHCKWSPCEVACCNCCIDMYSQMFVTVCMGSTFTFMPDISVSLFSLWLCIESQSVMNRSSPGLYYILLWIDVSRGEFIVFFVTVLQHLFWILLQVVYDLLLYLPPWQSNSSVISWDYVIYLVHPFQCCCIFSPYWSGFCLQMQMV